MSSADLRTHLLAAAVYIVALWLLWGVNWRAAVGVLLFVWANNLVYSARLKALMRGGPRPELWK